MRYEIEEKSTPEEPVTKFRLIKNLGYIEFQGTQHSTDVED